MIDRRLRQLRLREKCRRVVFDDGLRVLGKPFFHTTTRQRGQAAKFELANVMTLSVDKVRTCALTLVIQNVERLSIR